MPRALLLDGAAGGGFGLPQWLALLGAALLSLWACSLAVFMCVSAKRGGGKAPTAPPAQEMASRRAPAATSCKEAPTPEIASRNGATATSSSSDPIESRRCGRCAGCRQGGPCQSGAEDEDCCWFCAIDCDDDCGDWD